MKINTQNAPELSSNCLEIGNVYRCKGGASYDQKYWLVVGLPRDRVVMLGIDADGNIVSSANYGQYVFNNEHPCFKRGQEILGRVKDMTALCFDVEWEPLP